MRTKSTTNSSLTNPRQVLLFKVIYLNCWEHLERIGKRGRGWWMKRGDLRWAAGLLDRLGTAGVVDTQTGGTS